MMQVEAVDPLVALRKSRRPVRAPFMLTPLIDVLFLLLIFFMLNSNVLPFAMLPLAAVNEASGWEAATQSSGPTLLVRVDHAGLRIDNVLVDPADAPRLLANFAAPGNVSLTVLLGRDATVQDVVSLLDMIGGSRFTGVQVVSRGAGS